MPPPLASYLRPGHSRAVIIRYERTSTMTDLARGIDFLQQAVEATPRDDPDHRAYLSALSLALQRRFERTGALADLDAAIDAAQRAITATPTDHPHQAAALQALSAALQRRFERTGALADLDAAIDAAQRAITGIPTDDPAHLSTLSFALQRRFERTGALADLDAAIDATQRAVTATPNDDPDLALDLSNLGNALQDRFVRTGRLADLDEAVNTERMAADLTPADHPNRAAMLSNFGNALHARFGRTGNQADLDEAVDVKRAAVDLTPADHPNRALWLSNLGATMRIRFGRTGNQADLDEAVDAMRAAADLTPADHPNRALWLSNLGTALRIRFERTGDRADLDQAITAGQDAAAVEVASPRVRAAAARGWGHAAAVGRRWQEAVAGFEVAVGLLGRIAPHSLARHDQEYVLEELRGLASDAAACCAHAGLADRAIELFEQGRGVLLGQALDTRTDLTALAEQQPGLAKRFADLRDDLDGTEDRGGSPNILPTGTAGTAADDRATMTRLDVKRRRETAEAVEQGTLRSAQCLDSLTSTSTRCAQPGDSRRGRPDRRRQRLPVRLARHDPNQRRCAGTAVTGDDRSAPATAERRLMAVLGWLWVRA